MTEIDPRDDPLTYRRLVNTLFPHPLAWVTTRGADGTDHLTPFAFFGVVSLDSPILALSTVGAGFGTSENDTAIEFDSSTATTDIYTTEEFVVNLTSRSSTDQIHDAIRQHGPTSDLFETGIPERAPGQSVAPPRLAGATIALECILQDVVDFDESALLFGNITKINIDDTTVGNGAVVAEELWSSGRSEEDNSALLNRHKAMEFTASQLV